MAKIKLSAIASEIRGKLGGSYFRQDRSGTTLSNYSKKDFRSNDRKNLARRVEYDVQNRWKGLSSFNRSTWEGYASGRKMVNKHMNLKHLNGQQIFTKYHLFARRVGLPYIDFIWAWPFHFPENQFYIQLLNNELILGHLSSLPSEVAAYCAVTNPMRQSINNPGSKFRVLSIDPNETDQWNLTSFYIHIFGRLPRSGERIFFKSGFIHKSMPEVSVIMERHYDVP